MPALEVITNDTSAPPIYPGSYISVCAVQLLPTSTCFCWRAVWGWSYLFPPMQKPRTTQFVLLDKPFPNDRKSWFLNTHSFLSRVRWIWGMCFYRGSQVPQCDLEPVAYCGNWLDNAPFTSCLTFLVSFPHSLLDFPGIASKISY